ncbi:GNAT family N-acetyltransferase [Nocardioides panaciterrulae]|uniref:Ribosomal protein S18 acetylase RimI-like enzyme/acyl-CoA thioesterase FadM n=1 Tax=Nocardioides panaciterrulae TaxID=661492 RepID=A0A7Y9E9Y0_9ACTN|nr:GNAT family N-acetyltransferase [Nocardioides panaciterrulae]NYD43707.1 ribosomal protein S18 acetylase RimI-like enzyme/acyl-CoA thioesterase FadM [Nocardioides panaciterrulae]
MSERDARAALEAFPGLTWAPLERDRLPAVAEFYAECEAYDANPERRSLAGLEEFWDSPRSRPEEDTLVGSDETGRVVAVAWAGCNRVVTERRGVHLGGAVRPDRRGEGLGTAVLRWQLAHGLAWDRATRREGFGPLVMRLHAPVDQADVRDLAERHGLAVERYFFEMARPLGVDLAVPAVPGVRVVDWDSARSEEIHAMVDAAFRDHWGHVDRTPQMWQEAVTARAFRPGWSVLALDEETDAVVGAALNCAYEQDWEATGVPEGYTDELAVAATHRHRGIAGALLRESLRRFAASGLEAAALSVDTANSSGALRLYAGLGYEPRARTCVHAVAVADPAGPGRVTPVRAPHPTYEQLAGMPAYAEQPVPIAFEDVNGHLNVRHYTGIASEGLDESLVALGIPQNWPASGHACFSAEHHLRYLAELRTGDRMSARVRLLGRSERAVHALVYLLDESHRRVSFVMEEIFLHVDMQTRRTAPWPEDVAAAIDKRIAEDASLPWEPDLSGSMALR